MIAGDPSVLKLDYNIILKFCLTHSYKINYKVEIIFTYKHISNSYIDVLCGLLRSCHNVNDQ